MASYDTNENGLLDVIRISEMAGGSCLGAQRNLSYLKMLKNPEFRLFAGAGCLHDADGQ